LNKIIENDQTEFEKITYIVSVIKNVDETKLNQDQLKLWIDFLCRYLSNED
jgi:hypothetical protein